MHYQSITEPIDGYIEIDRIRCGWAGCRFYSSLSFWCMVLVEHNRRFGRSHLCPPLPVSAEIRDRQRWSFDPVPQAVDLTL